MHEVLTKVGKAYMFSIYNRAVRTAIKENREHGVFGEHWADSHMHEVVARNESDARRRIAERYPPEQGFVVETLAPVKD